jgi:hypothetical protein
MCDAILVKHTDTAVFYKISERMISVLYIAPLTFSRKRFDPEL